MSAYYRKKFNALNSKFKSQNNPKDLKNFKAFATDLMKKEFGEIVSSLPSVEFTKIYKALLTIVFSHRFNKQDPILQDIDFTNI